VDMYGDVRDCLREHRNDDPEPISVLLIDSDPSSAQIEFEEYSVAECLAYELSGAIFDGVTFGAQAIEVEY
jgi:hypothetical protein